MNYDWETWSQFLQENWLLLLIALIVLFIVVRIVKTVLKWAIVAVIILAIIVYSGYNLQDLKAMGSQLSENINLNEWGTQITDGVKQEFLQALVGEASDATYKQNKDGTFSVSTKNITLTGEQGGDEVFVSFKGVSLGKLRVDERIQSFIAQAKENG